jgi:hypothetical protein
VLGGVAHLLNFDGTGQGPRGGAIFEWTVLHWGQNHAMRKGADTAGVAVMRRSAACPVSLYSWQGAVLPLISEARPARKLCLNNPSSRINHPLHLALTCTIPTHACVQYLAADTLSAAYYAQFALNGGKPVGQSIPATEHSVMTSWPTGAGQLAGCVAGRAAGLHRMHCRWRGGGVLQRPHLASSLSLALTPSQ